MTKDEYTALLFNTYPPPDRTIASLDAPQSIKMIAYRFIRLPGMNEVPVDVRPGEEGVIVRVKQKNLEAELQINPYYTIDVSLCVFCDECDLFETVYDAEDLSIPEATAFLQHLLNGLLERL